MQSTIEVFDGFAVKWGASWSDLAANAVGSGLAAGNELLWQEQRVQLKWSFWPTDLAKQHPVVLGSGPEQFLKDYNGQTYWLCFTVNSFLPEGRLKQAWPDWLGFAVGYGGQGMIGGYGEEPWATIREREYRQYYLSLDIDLTQIKTRRRGLKLLFEVLNSVRVPLPAIRFSREGTRFFPIYF
jgi:hypothetical protein